VTLQRLVIHALYRTQHGPNPGTKARTKEVRELAMSGLRDALETLEGGAECVGTSGFTQREDVPLVAASPTPLQTARQVKGA
jgi:hypothetical protein